MCCAAVVDWELATLGDPLFDLAYFCMFQLFAEMPAGVPSDSDLLLRYCRAVQMEVPSEDEWSLLLALSCFKVSAILHGVVARASAGNASGSAGSSSKIAASLSMQCTATSSIGLELLRCSRSITPSVRIPRHWSFLAVDVRPHAKEILTKLQCFIAHHVAPVAYKILDEQDAAARTAMEQKSLLDGGRWPASTKLEVLKRKARGENLKPYLK